MTVQRRPAAEIDVDEALVGALLADQHPDLAERPLRLLGSGWDNVLYRLGDDLVVRLPRRRAGVDLVLHEQRWLPGLAPTLPLPVPTPVRIGTPGSGYAWPWSICQWVEGDSALVSPPADPAATASTLARFLAALHRPAPADAPPNPYRGVPLPDCDARVRERTAALDGMVDGGALLAVWDRLVATPPWPGPALWIHGDLHPGNLVIDRGALAGVIDFGDVTSGDPATDLAVAWMLLPGEHRDAFRRAAGRGDDTDTWARARGWALNLGLAYLLHSADAPGYGELGLRTLGNVLADGAPGAVR